MPVVLSEQQILARDLAGGAEHGKDLFIQTRETGDAYSPICDARYPILCIKPPDSGPASLTVRMYPRNRTGHISQQCAKLPLLPVSGECPDWPILYTVLTDIHGCFRASAAVIRLDGLIVNILLMRSFASGVTVSHSGDGNCKGKEARGETANSNGIGGVSSAAQPTQIQFSSLPHRPLLRGGSSSHAGRMWWESEGLILPAQGV